MHRNTAQEAMMHNGTLRNREASQKALHEYSNRQGHNRTIEQQNAPQLQGQEAELLKRQR